jgi:hypothetical protein
VGPRTTRTTRVRVPRTTRTNTGSVPRTTRTTRVGPRTTRATRVRCHGQHGQHGFGATDNTGNTGSVPRTTRTTRVRGHGQHGQHGWGHGQHGQHGWGHGQRGQHRLSANGQPTQSVLSAPLPSCCPCYPCHPWLYPCCPCCPRPYHYCPWPVLSVAPSFLPAERSEASRRWSGSPSAPVERGWVAPSGGDVSCLRVSVAAPISSATSREDALGLRPARTLTVAGPSPAGGSNDTHDGGGSKRRRHVEELVRQVRGRCRSRKSIGPCPRSRRRSDQHERWIRAYHDHFGKMGILYRSGFTRLDSVSGPRREKCIDGVHARGRSDLRSLRSHVRRSL